MTEPPGKVLFLCTGNYYRSRFAELLFNARAAAARLAWTADSRALAEDLGVIGNAGPISVYVLEGLALRGIPVNGGLRFPMNATEADLASADLIVALKEAEHRPLLRKRFPTWADRIEYWHIHDLDGAAPPEALAEIERHVSALLARLSSDGRSASEADDRGRQPERRR